MSKANHTTDWTEWNRPLNEIREDLFFRPENFQHEPWYSDFEMYLHIGICQPKPEHVLEIRKALKIMGYPTHVTKHDGKLFLAPGEIRNSVRKQDRERRIYKFVS